MNDGTVFPSFYHLWQDIEFRHSDALVSEVDLYFPDAKVAVFCDGAHHARGKQKARTWQSGRRSAASVSAPSVFPARKFSWTCQRQSLA